MSEITISGTAFLAVALRYRCDIILPFVHVARSLARRRRRWEICIHSTFPRLEFLGELRDAREMQRCAEIAR